MVCALPESSSFQYTNITRMAARLSKLLPWDRYSRDVLPGSGSTLRIAPGRNVDGRGETEYRPRPLDSAPGGTPGRRSVRPVCARVGPAPQLRLRRCP